FTSSFGADLCTAVALSGVDSIELGFANPGYTGDNPWLNVTADTIRQALANTDGKLKTTLLVNLGSTSANAIKSRSELPVDLLRIAIPRGEGRQAVEMAKGLAKKGHNIALNFMSIGSYSEKDLIALLPLIKEAASFVEVFYLADSQGSLLPKQ